MTQLAVRQTRFLSEPPYLEETISSALSRVLREYKTSTQEFLEILEYRTGLQHGKTAPIDWDDPPSDLIAVLAAGFNISIEKLQTHAIKDGPHTLSPGQRHAYCPYCFAEDRKARIRPYYRKSWAYSVITFCMRHEAPLEYQEGIEVDKYLHDVEAIALRVKQRGPKATRGNEIWAIAKHQMPWERRLHEGLVCVSKDRSVRSKWVKDQLELIELLGTVRGKRRKCIPSGRLGTTARKKSGISWDYNSTRRFAACDPAKPWEQFRSFGAPELRRAALFIAAGALDYTWLIGLPIVGPWVGPLRGRSANWWYSLVRSRFEGRPKDLREVDRLAARHGIPNYGHF